MSVNYYMTIEGVKPADEKFARYKSIFDTCVQSDVAVPAKVLQYFGFGTGHPTYLDEEYRWPIDAGVQVTLVTVDVVEGSYTYTADHDCMEPQAEPGDVTFIMDVTKLPEDIKTLRIHVWMN